MNHKVAKENITTKYLSRVKAFLHTKLSAINISRVVNTYATSVLRYGFSIIEWTDTDLEGLDIMTKSETSRNRVHHPRNAVARFHLSRNQGERGIPTRYERHNKQV